MSYRSYKSYIIIPILLLSLPSAVGALEVSFPSVQGVTVTDAMGPAQWVRYIFLMGQALVGLAIIYALVRSGVEWMTARDNAGQVKAAKDRIMGAVLGLIILLGSYIFLRTINPQLVELRNPSVPNPPSGTGEFYWRLFGQIRQKNNEGSQCSTSYECGPGLACVASTCQTDVANPECNATNPCAGGYTRCLDPTTGALIDLNIAGAQGVCTLKEPTGGNCNVYMAYGTCFVGTCQDNICVLTPLAE
ncbi:MAG: hypothetical protein HY452_02480 [Parcubacteria group bacterium]|nr:hypothetical protein [Parcubacteria group bacterium]